MDKTNKILKAIKKNDRNKIKKYLEKYKNIEYSYLLSKAIEMDKTEIIEILLDYIKDVGIESSIVYDLCIKYDNPKMADCLKKYGPRFDLKTYMYEEMEEIIRGNKYKILEYIIDQYSDGLRYDLGSDISDDDRAKYRTIDLLIKRGYLDIKEIYWENKEASSDSDD